MRDKNRTDDKMAGRRKILGIHPTVFSLGIVSFFTDVSSEMLVPIVPQFLKFVLGVSGTGIGIIEGIAEATASVLRVFAGYLADKFGRPKLLTVIGYGLSAVSKPFYIISHTMSQVLAIRFGDRLGKGIRSAPRDVLIADATEQADRGRAFGFHRAMDTAGATLGPLVILLMVWWFARGLLPEQAGKDHRDLYKLVFIVATIPAVIGWLVLVFFVPEHAREDGKAQAPKLSLAGFDKRFLVFLFIVTLFSAGNSSDAFLVLRARSAPVNMGFVGFLWVYVVFNALSAIVALRSGILSDRIGRKPVIVVGWLVFSLVYFAMGRVSSPTGVWIWFVVYGAYYGMTDGMLRAFAVDLAPAHLRGTAVGAYYTFTGVALLPASIIAGYLWDHVSHAAPFYYGSVTALVSAVLLAFLVRSGSPAGAEQTIR